MDTPILFIIFNRPDTTKRVFDEIKKAKPSKLYVAADGPRKDKEGERDLCEETRKIIEQVDWECEVKTLLRDENLGCKIGVSSAINWFFENEEMGIILEDDCLPNPSFFNFCQELLEKYKDDERIMMITGDNFQNGMQRGDESYYFSKYAFIWGWATWRRAWKHYNVNLKNLPVFKEKKQIRHIFEDKNEQKYWLNIFNLVYDGKIDTWDYQWAYAIFKNNALAIVPNVNLISNIGFGKNSTHTTGGPLANLETFSIDIIIHPNSINQNKYSDKYIFKKFFSPSKIDLFYNKISTMPIFLKIHKIVNKFLNSNVQDNINKRDEISAAEHFQRIINKGKNVFFYKNFSVFNGHHNIFLGSNINLVDTLINAGDKNGKVIIDDYVFFGHRVQILARGHDYNLFNLERQQAVTEKTIHIKEGAWIGSGSIILGGVTIGKHSVVAAGSIVKKDVPDYSIVGGNPARFIKHILKEKKDEL
ncbi:MAG: acyltransferase [bacterium]|nr:acyltransferase [bacterium]